MMARPARAIMIIGDDEDHDAAIRGMPLLISANFGKAAIHRRKKQTQTRGRSWPI
jgi:hypothetical protein